MAPTARLGWARTRFSASRWPPSRAAAADAGEPLWRYLGGDEASLLPVPTMNVLNGGVHADNPVDFQEFMIAPVGAGSFAQAIQMGAEVYHELQRTLKKPRAEYGGGRRGRLCSGTPSNEAPLELLVSAIAAAGYRPGEDLAICLDPAASEFFNRGPLRTGRRTTIAVVRGDGRLLVDDHRALPRSVAGRWDGRTGLGRLAPPHRAARQPPPARRRRHLRYQSGDPARGHRARRSPTRS